MVAAAVQMVALNSDGPIAYFDYITKLAAVLQLPHHH